MPNVSKVPAIVTVIAPFPTPLSIPKTPFPEHLATFYTQTPSPNPQILTTFPYCGSFFPNALQCTANIRVSNALHQGHKNNSNTWVSMHNNLTLIKRSLQRSIVDGTVWSKLVAMFVEEMLAHPVNIGVSITIHR